MRLYFPVDLTGNLIMIEKLVLSEIWTEDLSIFNPDALTSAPSSQAVNRNGLNIGNGDTLERKGRFCYWGDTTIRWIQMVEHTWWSLEESDAHGRSSGIYKRCLDISESTLDGLHGILAFLIKFNYSICGSWKFWNWPQTVVIELAIARHCN